jgi:hypothetical protein
VAELIPIICSKTFASTSAGNDEIVTPVAMRFQ